MCRIFQLSSVHHPMHFEKLNEPLKVSDVPADYCSWTQTLILFKFFGWYVELLADRNNNRIKDKCHD